ncbi:excalibur calcium-binding domain-containing protein [Epibacterium ulvae]|uniref:Excalibur calcium-binding domain-containing protein n=1 Tax=Epibacterium ulvae TaxID=1156985 RepID=A0A1G5PXV5_9RHOB|nr:excalibur calcium-binding domain-containing protein [Epibacterium ulvae]SCZ54106.1 Excalibur calcium-binding domain-containing protein [Epibacterium ulvae]
MRLKTLTTVAMSSIALLACAPIVPESGASVGAGGAPLGQQRPAPGTTINGDPLIPPAQITTEPLPSAGVDRRVASEWNQSTSVGTQTLQRQTAATRQTAPVSSGDDIAREAAAALRASSSNSGVRPLEASPNNPAPTLVGNPRISDENDFGAVSARQSIESDAQRLQQQRDQFQQIQPSALPQRSGEDTPNVVRYALSTRHPVGQRLYSRAGINLRARSARNCAEFATVDEAQAAFLAAGGPERDRKALDPDGDGYACAWDPRPYRAALR